MKGNVKLISNDLKNDLINIKILDLIESVEINSIVLLFIKYYELTIKDTSYSLINDNLNGLIKKCPNIVSEHFKNRLLVNINMIKINLLGFDCNQAFK